jgi:hypothetical protein
MNRIGHCGHDLKPLKPYANRLPPEENQTIIHVLEKKTKNDDIRGIWCDVRESLGCFDEPFLVEPGYGNLITKSDVVASIQSNLLTRRDHYFISRIDYEDGAWNVGTQS